MNNLIFSDWLFSIIVFLFMVVLRLTYNSFLYKLLYKIANWTDTVYDDFVLDAFKNPLYWLLFILAFYFGIHFAPYNFSGWADFTKALLRSSIVICITWGLCNLFSKQNGFLSEIFKTFGVGFSDIAVNIASPAVRFMVVILAVVLVGREFDYDVSVFFASLSLGSVAIAFAAKDVLANVFGSAVVLMDKPFLVGDWVVINGIEGVVETISFRSTCIRKFSQELVYIPNSIISNSPVVNFDRMKKRRLDFIFHLGYQSQADEIDRLLCDIRNWLDKQEFAMSKASVNFVQYDDYYMGIRVVQYVSVTEFFAWLELQNMVNMGIFRLAEVHGINIGVPTRVNIVGNQKV